MSALLSYKRNITLFPGSDRTKTLPTLPHSKQQPIDRQLTSKHVCGSSPAAEVTLRARHKQKMFLTNTI